LYRRVLKHSGKKYEICTTIIGEIKMIKYNIQTEGHNKQTHRQDRLQYTAPLASAQCNDSDR